MTESDKALVVVGEALRLKEAKREAMREKRRRGRFCLESESDDSPGFDVAHFDCDLCVYCGEQAESRDHVVARVITGVSPSVSIGGAMARAFARRLTVPSCIECNSVLSDHPSSNIVDRRAVIDGFLSKKIALGGLADWSDAEVAELGWALGNSVKRRADRLARLRRRMEWDTYSYLVKSFGSDIACLLGSMRVTP